LHKKSILRYGFKAYAERLANEYREQLNLHPCDPLCAFDLAKHMQVGIYEINEFLEDKTSSATLLTEWSALTMTTKKGNTIVIHNPNHSSARQQSNIMHELAHIICKHEIIELVPDFILPEGMRYFDEAQEEEAKCLGSTLQLPKPGLLWAKKQNMSNDEVAIHFNASNDMVNFRMNTTGISKITKYLIK
jgi:Zn-dependent peptidase ImmA (M78 family)